MPIVKHDTFALDAYSTLPCLQYLIENQIQYVTSKPVGVIKNIPLESTSANTVPKFRLGDLVVDVVTGIVGAVVDIRNDAAQLSNTRDSDGLSKLSNLRRLDLFNGCNVSSRGARPPSTLAWPFTDTWEGISRP